MNWKLAGIGLIFAVLWASASAATKIALLSAQPFVIAVTRFFIAGFILLLFAHGVKSYRRPQGNEWRFIMIYGLLNISIYLGLYVIGMQKISAGLGTLAVGMNPVMISLMAAFFLKQPIGTKTVLSLLLCLSGVMLAAYPLLKTSYASLDGIFIILASMIAYSAGAIYFSRVNWNGLHLIAINGWQTLLGGIFLLPVLLFTYKGEKNSFDFNFWSGTFWLILPVSIGAVQCWLYLLRVNAAKASYWLFLCPIFGFIISAILLNEPLSLYTAAGVSLVLVGLYMRNAGSKMVEANITE